MNPKDQFVLNNAAKAYQGPSIVDFLNSAGYDSSASSRATLGAKNNITGTPGSADYNTRLLNALRSSQAPATTANGSNSTIGAMGGADATMGGVSSPAPTAEDMAFENYLKALQPSSETTAAKEFLARSVANSKLAQERALNSGETMGFASGEAQRVNRNNDLTISALKDTYDVLKSSDESKSAIEKARYEYSKAKKDAERAAAKDAADANKPFKLSAGEKQYSWDEATKTYKVVGSMPEKPTASGVKSLTYTQQQDASAGADIANIAGQFKTIVENGSGKGQPFYGVPGDIYREAILLLQTKYPDANAPKKLQDMLKTLGIPVDQNYDGKPDDQSANSLVLPLPTN